MGYLLPQFRADESSSMRHFREEQHGYRSEFERDRDRVLYSKEFRRLSGKTQVFVTGFDDHARTRLTHTIEVSQIAQTLAKNLGLDETLTEAIALAHDIGHTPFGHVGERTLNLIMNGCDKIKDFNSDLVDEKAGFKHNWQGVRVVSHLEKISRNYTGLNLTDYTIWGILNHSKVEWGPCKYYSRGKCSLRHSNQDCVRGEENNDLYLGFYNPYYDFILDTSWTLEALIVRESDEIAQRHHDIEDGIEARIIDKDELLDKFETFFSDYLTSVEKDKIASIRAEKVKTYYLSSISKLLVNFLTTNLLENTYRNLTNLANQLNIKTSEQFNKNKNLIKRFLNEQHKDIFDIVSYEDGLKEKERQFQKYLCNRILNSHLAQSMDGKSNFIIRNLIKAYLTNPQQLPDVTIMTLYRSYLTHDQWQEYENKAFCEIIGELRNRLKRDHFEINVAAYRNVLLRTVCDYIAGMTDQFAFEQYELLFGSKKVARL